MADSAGREPVMNRGHVARFGAGVASILTTDRRRFTDMTRDNIAFVPSDNRVRVIRGAGDMLPIAWPSEARLHHDDIALFGREFGSGLCSALRLGYTFRLGPIGEWIFFEPENRSVVVTAPRGYWSEEWDAPGAELDLRNDCSLDDHEMERITELGVGSRGEGDLVAAKRCFMRCYLAALAARNEVAMAAALINLAIAYSVERRWCRVLALGNAAGFLSGGLPDDVREVIISLLREAHDREPTASGRMRSFLSDRARIGEEFTEMLWRLEDLAIEEELERMTS